MTPLVLLMNMLTSKGFKVVAGIVLFMLVVSAVYGMYESFLRTKNLKLRIKLNELQLSNQL